MDSLFLALDLPQSLKDELASLDGDIPGVTWIEPDTYHLTLGYLGSISIDIDDLIEELAMLRTKPFEIALKGIMVHPTKGTPRAVAALVTTNPSLITLRQKVNHLLTNCGLTLPRKRYQPHITLGRFPQSLTHPKRNQPLIDYLTRHALYQSRPLALKSFSLLSSTRTRHGQHYQQKAEFLLN